MQLQLPDIDSTKATVMLGLTASHWLAHIWGMRRYASRELPEFQRGFGEGAKALAKHLMSLGIKLPSGTPGAGPSEMAIPTPGAPLSPTIPFNYGGNHGS